MCVKNKIQGKTFENFVLFGTKWTRVQKPEDAFKESSPDFLGNHGFDFGCGLLYYLNLLIPRNVSVSKYLGNVDN